MPRLRGNQVRVFVIIGNALKYGYKTNEKRFKAVGGELGQSLAAAETGVFYGADSPKPNTATKLQKTGRISGFFSDSKRATLIRSGWLVNSSGRIRGIKTSGLSRTVCVNTNNGYKYTWNTQEPEVALELGAEIPTSTDNLVWGSFPKPPRATKRTPEGSQSTFCPPTQTAVENATAQGWTVEGIDGEWISA